jgi:hypothetical protein
MKKINNDQEVKVGDWIACFNSEDDEDDVDERKNIINLNKGDIIGLILSNDNDLAIEVKWYNTLASDHNDSIYYHDRKYNFDEIINEFNLNYGLEKYEYFLLEKEEIMAPV